MAEEDMQKDPETAAGRPSSRPRMVRVVELAREVLRARGYTEQQIRKIYGENTLRVMREVERIAKS